MKINQKKAPAPSWLAGRSEQQMDTGIDVVFDKEEEEGNFIRQGSTTSSKRSTQHLTPRKAKRTSLSSVLEFKYERSLAQHKKTEHPKDDVVLKFKLEFN